MEISYVQPGQKITAQGYNSLVDAVGGAGNYSAEGFQNEKSGTTLWNRASLSMKYFNGAWRSMFQVVEATYWKQTARGQWNPPNKTKTLLIDLGSDADALKANVTVMGQKVENAAVIVGDSSSMDAEINDNLYKNASEKKAQWVDLGISPDQTSFIAGDFFKEVKEDGEGDDKKKATKYYFAVTDKSENDVIDRAKQIFGIEGDDFKLIKRFILSKKGDASIGSDIKNYVQAHTGVLSYSTPTPDISSDMISVDSDITDLMLSSIETLSVEYQISGISGDIETKVGDAYSLWNFDKAERISLGQALDKEKSKKDSAASCRVDVVIRIGKADNSVSAPAMVDYLELSTLVTSCDTDFYSKKPKEIKSTSIERTSAEKGQPALQLKGFKDEYKSDVPEKYDLIVRETTADEDKVLKYISPADLFQVDNDISSLSRSSLQKQADPNDADKKFVQLYNFDQSSRDVTLSIDNDSRELPAGYSLLVRRTTDEGDTVLDYANLSIGLSAELSCDSQGTTGKKSIAYNAYGELELYNFDKTNTDLTVVTHTDDGYTPTNQLVLVKNTSSGQLQYARLFAKTRTDTEYDQFSRSIEYNKTNNEIKINGWSTKANTAASTVSADAASYDVLMRYHNGSFYDTKYMNIAPLLSGGGAMLSGETTDLTVITQVVWDTSTHRIQPKGKKLSFVNGLLSAVSETEFDVGGINTTPWTGE